MIDAVSKPECRLIGSDGNVFAIIGAVSKVLKRAGQPDRATEFVNRAMGSSSYDEVLSMLPEYVEIS